MPEDEGPAVDYVEALLHDPDDDLAESVVPLEDDEPTQVMERPVWDDQEPDETTVERVPGTGTFGRVTAHFYEVDGREEILFV